MAEGVENEESTDADIEELKALWEKAPEGLKNWAPAIAGSLAVLVNASSYSGTNYPQLKALAGCLVPGAFMTREAAKQCLDRCQNYDYIKRYGPIIEDIVTSESKGCDDAFREVVNGSLHSIANKVLLLGIGTGSITAAIEGYKVYQLWNTIKDARNLIYSSPEQREKLESELKDIGVMIQRLDSAMEDLARIDIPPGEFANAKFATEKFINDIRIRVDKALSEIDSLRVEVDGVVQLFQTRRNMAKASAVTGTLGGFSTLANTVLFAECANPIFLAISGIVGVAEIALAITNAALVIITAEDLKQLEEELQQINEIRGIAQQYKDYVNEQSTKILDLEVKRNPTLSLDKYERAFPLTPADIS